MIDVLVLAIFFIFIHFEKQYYASISICFMQKQIKFILLVKSLLIAIVCHVATMHHLLYRYISPYHHVFTVHVRYTCITLIYLLLTQKFLHYNLFILVLFVISLQLCSKTSIKQFLSNHFLE